MLKDGEFYNKWNHCMVMALILIFDKKYSIVLWIIFHFKNIHSKLANKWFMTQTPITSYNRSLKDLSDPTSKYKVVFIE